MMPEESPAPAAAPAPAQPIWPFGLKTGLPSEEACRLASQALHAACAFRNGTAELEANPPVVVDKGPLAGKSIRKLKMTIERGKLASVAFQLAAPVTNAPPAH
jgi:hypothetical protein